MRYDIDTMRCDIAILRWQFSIVRCDIGTMRCDIAILRWQIGTMRYDIGTVICDIAILRWQIGIKRSYFGSWGRFIAGAFSKLCQQRETFEQQHSL